jgi:hypothetical protein
VVKRDRVYQRKTKKTAEPRLKTYPALSCGLRSTTLYPICTSPYLSICKTGRLQCLHPLPTVYLDSSWPHLERCPWCHTQLLTPAYREGLDLVASTAANGFVTGRAGSGKPPLRRRRSTAGYPDLTLVTPGEPLIWRCQPARRPGPTPMAWSPAAGHRRGDASLAAEPWG